MPRSAKPTVDVGDWINRQRIGRLQIQVLGLCGACTLLEGFDAQTVAYAAPVLIHDWGLSRGAFTPVFMAGLVGLLVGCLGIAPLADRFGRKSVMLGSVIAFAVFSFLTSASWSLTSLCVFRFLTGLGVGGGMANAIALTSEYFPERKRAAMTVIMFVGFPVGVSLGGFLSAVLIPSFGWQIVFFAGGILPIFVAMAIAFALPESIRHLVVHHVDADRVASVLNRINHRAVFLASTRFVIAEEAKRGLSVGHLFREGRAVGTILIWIIFFMSLLDIFLVVSWLPILLNDVGLSLSLSAVVLAVLLLSGVAMSVVAAPLIERHGLFAILVPAYLLAVVGIAALGAADDFPLLLVASAVAGIGIVCGQNTANALAASFYPTYVRATGIGWALGIGCIGAVIGPTVGGIMAALHLSRETLFLVGAVPELIAVAAILGLMRLERTPAASLAQLQVSVPL